MVVNDIISDTIARINNALIKKKKTVKILNNKNIINILTILVKNGYFYGYYFMENNKYILIFLKYKSNKSVIQKIKRVSKPGNQKYISLYSLIKLENIFGLFFLSTSKGILSNYEAIINQIGGEIIFEIF
jgi:small subunit ribosomal protein S8